MGSHDQNGFYSHVGPAYIAIFPFPVSRAMSPGPMVVEQPLS